MSEYKCGHCCRGICSGGCNKHTDKMNTYDWLADLPDNTQACDIVEVQFKPPRKGYFINTNKLPLVKGDIVAVESSPGHDIGTVTMTGRLVKLQIKKANLKPDTELKKIYRIAKPVDLEKWNEARAREHKTMIESRQIALSLGLKMKIGDVEYQGDGNKAIFYYIADERVDFRQLIKVLAEKFRVRIEMKQIGARQEAGRIGGIGPCGRELCCATWITNFVSVSTSAARFQDLSLNPQKLAGQCAKLKCCLNYEVDQYVESLKRMPSREMTLHTQDSEYYFFKSDILNHQITYSSDKHILANEKTISARRAFEIIQMNKEGKKPESLLEDGDMDVEVKSLDILDDNINRFDRKKNKKKKGQANKNAEVRKKGDEDTQPAAKNEETTRTDNSGAAPQQKKRHKRQGADDEGRRPFDKNRGDDRQPRQHRDGRDDRRRNHDNRQRNGENGEGGNDKPVDARPNANTRGNDGQ